MSVNYKFADFYLDTSSRSLIRQGKVFRLSPRAFNILLMLVKNQSQVVGKSKIIEKVWAESFVEENNLAVHISALRRVLGENFSNIKHIETISGVGYRFLTPVETVSGNKPEKMAAAAFARQQSLDSIAILPFVNKSGDAKFDYLAEGIAESLILNLSQLSKLKVIGYSAVAKYKNAEIDIREVGFLLGVDSILVGSVFEADEMLEISLELIQVSNLSHLWGMQYQHKFEQLLKTRTEISLAIAERLHLRLSKTEERQLSKKLTDNSEAYKLYLKGLHFFERRDKPSLIKSVECFEKAVELDAEFALAYAGLADAYLNLAHFFILPTIETVAKAHKAIEKAIFIDPNLSEAHSVNGLLQLFRLNIKNAKQSLEKAIEFNPNNSSAYSYYSIYLAITGEAQKSLQNQYKAIEISPFIESRNATLATRFYLLRQYELALEHIKESLEIFPNNALLCLSRAYCYAELKMFDEALENLQIFYSQHQTNEIIALKAYIYSQSGRKSEAFEIIRGLEFEVSINPVDLYDIGVVYGNLGEKDKAFEYFEKAYDSKFSHLFLINADPRVDCLRDDPRFNEFLRRLGLTS